MKISVTLNNDITLRQVKLFFIAVAVGMGQAFVLSMLKVFFS